MPDLQPISQRCTRCGRAKITVDEGGVTTEKCLECPTPNAAGNTVHPSWQPVLAKKMADFDERHKTQTVPEQAPAAQPVAQGNGPRAAAPATVSFEAAVQEAIRWLKSAPMAPNRKSYTAVEKAVQFLEKSLQQ